MAACWGRGGFASHAQWAGCISLFTACFSLLPVSHCASSHIVKAGSDEPPKVPNCPWLLKGFKGFNGSFLPAKVLRLDPGAHQNQVGRKGELREQSMVLGTACRVLKGSEWAVGLRWLFATVTNWVLLSAASKHRSACDLFTSALMYESDPLICLDEIKIVEYLKVSQSEMSPMFFCKQVGVKQQNKTQQL